jgi:hypothetical protein
MMKKPTAYLALMALLSIGCTNDEEAREVDVPNGQPAGTIVLTASMGNTDATRGSLDVQTLSFDEGELINVECTTTGTTTTSSAVYRTGAADESNKNVLTPDGTALTWPANSGTVSIHAYYPSTVTSSTTSFSVQADQSAANNSTYKQSDLMYAEPIDGQAKTASVPLTFHHALSKIVVNIVGTGSLTADDLATCEVAVKACRTATITNGVATPVADAINAADYDYITIGTGTTVAGIIVPQTIDGSTTAQPLIRVKWNNSVLYLMLKTSKTFAERLKYTYTLSVGSAQEISLIRSEITDWQTVDFVTSM